MIEQANTVAPYLLDPVNARRRWDIGMEASAEA